MFFNELTQSQIAHARELQKEIESLRQQLATMTAAYDEQVTLHNKTLDELAVCERERDELVAAAKRFCDDWKFCRGSEWPVRALQELNAALAKVERSDTGQLGADKTGKEHG